MSDPFAPYYYDEEEYDLDKFINDYRDVLNTHQPEFFSNTRGEIKEETFTIVSAKEASKLRAKEKAKAKREAKKAATNQISLDL